MRQFFLILLVASPTLAQEESTAVRVDLETAKKLYDEGAYLLDVRTPREFEAGHLPGANLIPVSELSNRLDEIHAAKNAPLLVYCAVGGRSQRAAGILSSAGFTNVNDMQDGFNGWSAAELPSEDGPVTNAVAEVEDAATSPAADEETLADAKSKPFSVFGCAASAGDDGPRSVAIPGLLATALLLCTIRARAVPRR